MRILRLFAENIKRIKVVDITPPDNMVIISGKNEQGKTTILDCIDLAFRNRVASKLNPVPLRRGTDKGLIDIETELYDIRRKFTPEGTVLQVKTKDGNTVASPQKLLDGFLNYLSFDPWEFSRKSEKEQLEMLGDVLFAITGGTLNIADFETRYQAAFDARAEANREKKRLTTLLSNIRPPSESEPREEVNVSDLVASINESIRLENEEKHINAQISETLDEIRVLELKLLESKEKLVQLNDIKASLPPIPDVKALQLDLMNIQNTNKRARDIQEYAKILDTLESINAEIEKCNNTMELVEIEKAEALESSPLPVKGLSITPDGLMVTTEDGHNVPFCQASAAQRLRISTAIAMAANPTLKVIRITDGSLLDDESMRIIQEMVKDNSFQCWVEYASRNDNDKIGIYIEDGTVKT